MCEQIETLLKEQQPLPEGVELLTIEGEWKPLSDVALASANSPDWANRSSCFWHHGWLDIIDSLRIKPT